MTTNPPTGTELDAIMDAMDAAYDGRRNLTPGTRAYQEQTDRIESVYDRLRDFNARWRAHGGVGFWRPVLAAPDEADAMVVSAVCE